MWSVNVSRTQSLHFFDPLSMQGKQILKDFYWDPRDLTVPLPSGEYAVLLTWIFDKRPQFVTKVYFTFHQDIFKD